MSNLFPCKPIHDTETNDTPDVTIFNARDKFLNLGQSQEYNFFLFSLNVNLLFKE
jgi:hypothetical protein